MPNTTITDLPAAGSADPNAVVAADNSAGTLTEKVTLQQIADLASGSLPNGYYDGDVLTWDGTASAWVAQQPFTLSPGSNSGDVLTWDGVNQMWASAAPYNPLPSPANANNGDVLTYDASSEQWYAAAPSGGNPFDQTLNTSDAVTFLSVSMDNGSSLSEGSFDNSTGGANGISLNCAVGYELNWQGGRLRCTTDGGVTTSNILSDSAIEFPGAGQDNMQIDSVAITFPDGSAQTTAAIPALSFVPNDGDVLTWDDTAGAWTAAAPSGGGSLPSGTAEGDLLSWDATGGSWAARTLTQVLPSASVDGDTLRWDAVASAWTAQQPPAGIFPPQSPNDGDVLTYDSGASSWVAAAPSGGGSLPNGNNNGDVLTWDSGTSQWSAAAVPTELPGGTEGYILKYTTGVWSSVAPPTWRGDWDSMGQYYLGEVVVYDSRLWRHVNAGPSNYTPGQDPNYWVEVAPPAELPSSANSNDILSWNGSQWVGVMPSTPGLPSASNNQILRYDGTNWVASNEATPGVMLWDTSPSYIANDLVAYAGALYRSLTSSGNTNQVPDQQPSYWERVADVPLTANQGDTLAWDSSSSSWVAGAPNAIAPPGSPNNGDVLTYDGTNAVWTAAQPASVGIPAPNSPADGDVLTYSAANSAWESAAPTGGGGIVTDFARITAQFTTTSGQASDGARVTGLNVTIDEGTWLIQGLLLVTDAAGIGNVPVHARLEMEGNTSIYGAFHHKTPNEVDCNIVHHEITTMQMIATGAVAGSPPQHRIPFSAIAVLAAEAGPQDTIHVRIADGADNGDDVGCEAQSWMVAIKLA